MRRMAVINQKGGVGKTTTTVNLGAALARLGRRVLVCDLDPQCNLTVHLDIDPAAPEPGIYDVLVGKAALGEVARPTEQEGLFVAPAGVDLAGVEVELATEVGRELLLRQAFEADAAARASVDGGPGGERAPWDYVLVDCPPSLGLLALNALVACDEVLVPIQAEFFALQGLGKLLQVVDLVQQRLNPRLRITAMVSCRHDPSTNLSRQVIEDVRSHFGSVLLQTVIRRNVKLAEAPSHGKTIFSYDAASRGAEDYLALAREVLAQTVSGRAVADPGAAEGDASGQGNGQAPAAESDAPDEIPTGAAPGNRVGTDAGASVDAAVPEQAAVEKTEETT